MTVSTGLSVSSAIVRAVNRSAPAPTVQPLQPGTIIERYSPKAGNSMKDPGILYAPLPKPRAMPGSSPRDSLAIGRTCRRAILACRKWPRNDSQTRLCRERQKSFPPTPFSTKPCFAMRSGKMVRRPSIMGPAWMPVRTDWMDSAWLLYRLQLYNPRQPAAWLPLLRQRISALVRRASTD